MSESLLKQVREGNLPIVAHRLIGRLSYQVVISLGMTGGKRCEGWGRNLPVSDHELRGSDLVTGGEYELFKNGTSEDDLVKLSQDGADGLV